MITKNSINSEIAEILGAFIGDGWIESDKNALYITGSPIEDKLYYDEYLAPLFSKHFSKVKPRIFPYWGVYGISLYKKDVIKNAINLGFQTGKKCLVAEIPKNVFSSKDKNVIKSVLRGIFDTDGSFWCERSNAKTSTAWKRTYNSHPEMQISSCSLILLKQIHILLAKLGIESNIRKKNSKGFKCGRNIHDAYVLQIRKRSQIDNWFKIIGTSNPRHKTRFDVWTKFGHLPPHTNINQRIEMLKK